MFNHFFQFFYDGFTLVNKEKYQAFVMKSSDQRSPHNNVLALSFNKVLSSESDKFSKLAEYVCTEVLDNEFFYVFASSLQDLVASKVEDKLNIEKVDCEMHPEDKVDSSAVRELARSKDNVIVSAFPERVYLINKLRNMVKHFESNPANKKNMIFFRRNIDVIQ